MTEETNKTHGNIQEMFEKIMEKQNELSEKQDKTWKRLESIENKNRIPNTEKMQIQEPVVIPYMKSFVLEHTFENVLKMGDKDNFYSEEEEHFGLLWKLNLYYYNGKKFSIYTYCTNPWEDELNEWSVEADIEVKLVSKIGDDKIEKRATLYDKNNEFEDIDWEDLFKSEKLANETLDEGTLQFEVTFQIKSMKGFGEKLRNFDESNMFLSDIVLNVNNEKFYVSKLYLATHSPYFQSLFLGKFEESNKSEIKLSGIDSYDFQNYLEILHFHDSINEYNVEGILLIADMYDTQIVLQKCEEFLVKKSNKTLKKKLEMAVRYNLNELKNYILSQMETRDDIKKVLPYNLESLNHSIMAELLKKSLSMK